jgi:prepilin-type N-terminal cleavage/methylation domain-containing protein
MRPLASRLRFRLQARGYTAVEILMAMTVMAIGAAAVISMQKASIQGNLDARKTDIANAIARTWVERLERDAMAWTLPSPSNPSAASNIANAKLLNGHVNATWYLPIDEMGATATPTETMSPGFDILGRDLPLGSLGNAQFCVNVRLTWLVNNELIRAEVRVLWPRLITNAPPSTGFCDDTDAALPSPDPMTYHAIYVTTAIKENATQ